MLCLRDEGSDVRRGARWVGEGVFSLLDLCTAASLLVSYAQRGRTTAPGPAFPPALASTAVPRSATFVALRSSFQC